MLGGVEGGGDHIQWGLCLCVGEQTFPKWCDEKVLRCTQNGLRSYRVWPLTTETRPKLDKKKQEKNNTKKVRRSEKQSSHPAADALSIVQDVELVDELVHAVARLGDGAQVRHEAHIVTLLQDRRAEEEEMNEERNRNERIQMS